jgi:putative ABC transport system ATP-binding protein
LAGKISGVQDYGRADTLLSSLDLAEKSHRKPDALSQGEQQRAAIARAVFNNPSIIVADEPTSALDDVNAERVMKLLEEQARGTGAALLVATHDARISARFDNIIRLS